MVVRVSRIFFIQAICRIDVYMSTAVFTTLCCKNATLFNYYFFLRYKYEFKQFLCWLTSIQVALNNPLFLRSFKPNSLNQNLSLSQTRLQKWGCCTLLNFGNLFWSAFSNYFSSLITSAWPHINNVVASPSHLHIVLNHHHRIPCFN